MLAELFYRNLRHYGAQADFVVAPPTLPYERPQPKPGPNQVLLLPNYDNATSYAPLLLYAPAASTLINVLAANEPFGRQQVELLKALQMDRQDARPKRERPGGTLSPLYIVAFVRKLAAGGPLREGEQTLAERVRLLEVEAVDEAEAWQDRLVPLVASRLNAIKLAQLRRPMGGADEQTLYARRLRDRVCDAYAVHTPLTEAEPLCAQTLANMINDWREWH